MSTRSDDPDRRDIPPTYTIEPVSPPPMTKGSTSALSPLGTDDEAAGFPPKPEQVDLARHQENSVRWRDGAEKDSYAHQNSSKALYAYVGFIGLVLILFVGAFSMF
jgi:hypothetical protein